MLPNQTTVAEVLVYNLFCYFSVPREMHSNQGRNFKSSVFRKVCRVMGIVKTRTTPLHHQSDDMVERFNKMIEKNLRIAVNGHHQSAVHETTGTTPAKALFGKELILPTYLIFRCPED